MSTNTKLTIKSTSYADDKKTVSNTINYVNPNLDNSTALELAQRMNALTLNTYKSTDKIETIELDSIIPKADRTLSSISIRASSGSISIVTPTLIDGVYTASLSTSQITQSFFSIWFAFTTTYADSIIILPYWTTEGDSNSPYAVWLRQGSQDTFQMRVSLTSATAQVVEGSFTFPESQNYKAEVFKFEITITEV